MELAAGRAVVLPGEGESFDPRQIFPAVEEAGFSPRELALTAVGTLVERDGAWLLEMAGPLPALRLEPPADAAGDLAQARGRRLRVAGAYDAPESDGPPRLRVGEWQALPPP